MWHHLPAVTNHCLFVLYLTSVAFGHGWISDTKFHKFLDKDWIWILKIFSDSDQESKSQYPLTSAMQLVAKLEICTNPNKYSTVLPHIYSNISDCIAIDHFGTLSLI